MNIEQMILRNHFWLEIQMYCNSYALYWGEFVNIQHYTNSLNYSLILSSHKVKLGLCDDVI